MGMIEEDIEVTLSGMSINYYESLGYVIPRYYNESKKEYVVKSGKTIMVSSKDLPLNSNNEIHCECDKCKVVISTIKSRYVKNINKNKIFLCKDCSMKSNIETLKKISTLINELNGKLITDIYNDKLYITDRTKLKILDVDGYYRNINYNKLQSRRNFGSSPFSPSNPYAIENMKIWMRKNNLDDRLELVSTEINSFSDHMSWHCKKHNKSFDRIFNNLKKNPNGGCDICFAENIHERMAYNFEDIKIKSLLLNKNVKVEGNYENSSSILHFTCTDCGNEWDRRWNAFSAAPDCPVCKWEESLKSLDGYYCPTISERNKDEWIKRDATVYIIKLFNNDLSEYFYKVGITTKDIEVRFNGSYAMPYNYEVLGLIKTNLYDAIHMEHGIDKHNRDFGYKQIPKIKFNGYTECYVELDFGEYSDLIEWCD